MQCAKVVALFKGREKNMFKNYRPISLLSIFSKGLEKIIHKRFYIYLEKFSIISNSQHGFRKHRSTESALLVQKRQIIECFENKELIMGVYIDFSKAFDLINHKILFMKLENYSIRGTALDLFKSYLQYRTQFVNNNNYISTIQKIRTGVPQGSVLGPLLFIIFINDIENCVPHANIVS